ncbi:formimidoylglutamase [Aquicella lusitana]|uniref:Formimidoylglutamase n=1 Tax=Aquicella lusitana TaxID=254246 RepID=A0A370GYL6_9COXI|nr:formimidoylglutamase [Aquicella lusitana]RDI48701.1 formiminoglutamase [Aquicella lusitana]VVC73922.1 Formimidoylglutamase [Aquicella lusitana]
MNWESRYLPPDPTIWQGRVDIPDDSCFYQHIQPLNLLTQKLEKASALTFAIVGFKCDEGVARDLGRTGAFEGPTAIRHRLAKLPVQNTEIICYDAGNIICTDHDLEASQQALADMVAMLLEHNIRPIIIGGGHELAWGHYQGISKVYPATKRLGIISFDAHFDLNPLQPSHRGSATTSFFQIAEAHQAEKRHFDYNCIGIQHVGNIRQSFDIAKQYKVKLILADEMHQGLQEKCIDFVDRVIDENDIVYMSISLDVFSPAFAPGVSTIQPLGLNPWHVIPIIRQAANSGKMISYDIAEHVPRYDIDHRTAKLAATLIYEIIHHHSKHPRIW